MNEKINLTIKETFALAVQHHQKNNLQVAEKLYKEILKTNPNHANTRNNLGSVLKELGESRKAISCFQKAIEIQSNHADAHYNLGSVLKELGESRKAISCFQKAIQIQPNHADAHYNLGNTFRELEESEKAIGCYEKAIQIQPNHADAHNNLGNAFRELEESEKAIGCYEKAIQIQPNHAHAHNNLGNALKDLGEHQKAIGCYEKAIAIQSNHADTHYNLGNALKELGESRKAISCYEKAIEIQSNHADAHYNLGNTLKDLGEHKKAISYFQKTNSIVSKEELLKYSYLLDGLEDYKKKLEKFVKEETCSRNVAATAAYVSKKENIKNIYPFCKDPLNFVSIKNLKNVLTLTDNFSKNLLKRLETVHSIWEPKTTTTKGGYQTLINLFNTTDIEILKLQKIIEKQIIIYRKVYERSEDYFIKKWPHKCKFSAWYVKLLKQGHQKPHMHARGWLSGVFYVKVPKLLNKYEGSIKFLLSGYDFPEDKNLPNLIHSPNDFDLVLFPSSLIHQTIPFNSQDRRHSIAFDLIPK